MFEMAIEVRVGFWDCGRWGFRMGVKLVWEGGRDYILGLVGFYD